MWESSKGQADQRNHPRYAFHNQILIESSHGRYYGDLTDVSVGGLGVLLGNRLNQGERVSLKAELGPKKVLFAAQAVVRWASEERVGLEFAETDVYFIEELLRSVHVSRVESFIGCRLPEMIKSRYINDWVHKTYNQEEICQVIDFKPPFLKIDKVITFDSYEKGNFVTKKSLSVGRLYIEDVDGHFNNTIFLAKCGQLMGQAASILIGALNPGTAPQVVEVDRIQPILSDEYLWQPRKEGSIFFVESEVRRRRLHISIVNVLVSFGDILMGKVEGLKLILTPKESIWTAKELPPWE